MFGHLVHDEPAEVLGLECGSVLREGQEEELGLLMP